MASEVTLFSSNSDEVSWRHDNVVRIKPDQPGFYRVPSLIDAQTSRHLSGDVVFTQQALANLLEQNIEFIGAE